MDLLVHSDSGQWDRVPPYAHQTESDFQELVQATFEGALTSQGDRASIVAREVSTPEGGRIDVVAVDQDGLITLCECKLDRNASSRREVLGQILEYGGSLNGMSFDDFSFLMGDRLGTNPIEALRERADDDFNAEAWKETVTRALAEGRFRLVIAVDQLTDVLKQTVLYLNERATFSLVAAELRRISHGGSEFLMPSLFGEEAAQRKLPRRSPTPTVRDSDTVVVAAKVAYPEYKNFGAYVCQPKRAFRETTRYLGFYAERTIYPEFPAIVQRYLDVPFTTDEIARRRADDELGERVADVIEKVLANPGSRKEGERYQVVLLDPSAGFVLNEAVRHGGPGAWTQGQRYTKADALRTGPPTTDHLAAAEG